MTISARDCAALHAMCFTTPRPWSEAEFAAYQTDPLIVLVGDTRGFALGRVVVDEVELLTIVVAPEQQRKGIGAALLNGLLTVSQSRGAETCFLEVAADNPAAIALYRANGFGDAARRAGYYRQKDGTAVDAIVMSKRL